MNDISGFSAGISVLEITYIIASVLFILGLKMLSHPLTARRGNLYAAVGMVLAILATILFHHKDGQPIGNIGWIIAAICHRNPDRMVHRQTCEDDGNAAAGIILQRDGRSGRGAYFDDGVPSCQS